MAKLSEYRRKREFERTPEPAGETAAIQEKIFVVQKHAATRLHYDFRLAIDGALKSWAVPKGPSLNPADKRLAVQTEDHPMDYANFEGNIPKGNYGAGSVMVWDRGTFRTEGELDAQKQVDRGEIKFHLEGEKLRGSFVLVKLKDSEKGNEWLMIKHEDSSVDPAWDIDTHDGSVLTGRTLEEIAEELPPKRDPSPIRPSELQGARKSAIPSQIQPMLATLIERPFSDPNWLFEIKWDGERAIAWIDDGKLTLLSRRGNDITDQYPEMATLAQSISAKRAVLDGELVVLDERGHSDFERLQDRMHVRKPPTSLITKHPVTYYVFDLLYCDGYDLRSAPVSERKNLLRRLLHGDEHIRFSDHQVEQGKELFELVRKQGLEGIIGKRTDSPYASGRNPNWVKLKATKTLDAVIGGWTAPRGGRAHLGSLLLGLYQGKKLIFIGHTGSGLNEKSLDAIIQELRKRETRQCPFDTIPETNEKAYWAKPELVARVRFTGWTQEKRLRAPVFIALREDARAEDCRWESEVAAEPVAAVVRAPEIVGQVLKTDVEIETELFRGNQENIFVELDGKRFRLSNLNKIYFPDAGITKRDLLAYYYRITDYILPFLKDRPLVMRRYPDGIKGQAFFQKDFRDGVPEWLEIASIPSETKKEDIHYAVANDRASLLFLTGLGCIDHNPWSSRSDDLEHPDYFFFDIDPAEGTDFSVVMKIAKALYDKLHQIGVKTFLKTSGATGFHLYIPVERRYTYAQLRAFAEIIERLVSAENPKLVTHERIVAKRPAGSVLIDVAQNAEGRPLASAYSVRAFPGAPVSAPITPEELRLDLKPGQFNLRRMFARIEKKGDLWAQFRESRQALEELLEQVGQLVLPSKSPHR